MRPRSPTVIAAAACLGALASACVQILDAGGELPPEPVDATVDGGHAQIDAGHDATVGPRDAGRDAADAHDATTGVRDAGLDGSAHDAGKDAPDAARDASAACGEGGVTRCTDGGREVCGSDGGWSATDACTSTELCSAGGCGCIPGESLRCGRSADDAATVEVCGIDGGWRLVDTCTGDTPVCRDGGCACDPGAKRCGDGGRQACGDGGSWTADPCDAGAQCTPSGTCGCVPATTECVDGGVAVCGTNGVWTPPAACPGATVCSAGRCGCEPGTRQCAPDSFGWEVCGDSGAWGPATPCAAPYPICSNGSCGCELGATQCDRQVPERCVPGDAAPTFQATQEGGCPGTCTLSGCAAVPPSCAPDGGVPDAGAAGLARCPAHDGGFESCCASYEVPGGAFYPEYDGVNPPYTTPHIEATVSGFRLDRFEVTVGRFREFTRAIGGDAGWRPPPGSGKHAHLHGGQGLTNASVDAGYETGWQVDWDAELSPAALAQGCAGQTSKYDTFGGDAGDLPVNCVSWVQAYAFCIWDGGFLPSEYEWNFAASGGGEQRAYPWSPALAADAGVAVDDAITCDLANYDLCSPSGTRPVGSLANGDSKWLQADMAGNVFENTLDVLTPPPDAGSCRDCAFLGAPAADAAPPERVQRGGSFVVSNSHVLFTSYRGQSGQTGTQVFAGLRCARTP